ncbi:hypothetical protein CMUS01_07109 [Colletotrichum musicola]|uniref:Uncharacterized protein n=1 Tax=Colletotrichum musicola TaxID=2175873 RepID=A0A8H6NFT4_9PEZI|nr:hypothetical protein CMUS01_07109 [Colletotrichum musicola]
MPSGCTVQLSITMVPEFDIPGARRSDHPLWLRGGDATARSRWSAAELSEDPTATFLSGGFSDFDAM